MSAVDASQRESVYRDLLLQVSAMRSSMIKVETETLPRVGEIRPENLESARNLAHYLALRRGDLRPLQEKLASLGLSSLGRSESHVLATVDAVMEILTDLVGGRMPLERYPPLSYESGRALLKRNADAVLGPAPKQRTVRIMVTMPTEAATDYTLVENLVSAGMNLMRVNCAHDDSSIWSRMIENLRKAESATKRECRLMMDIPGPKVRTGPIAPGPRVVKVRPHRSEIGSVMAPATVRLTKVPSAEYNSKAEYTIPLQSEAPPTGLVKAGDKLLFKDARDSKRSLTVVSFDGQSVMTELRKTAYFETGAAVSLRTAEGEERAIGTIGEIPPLLEPLILRKGDRLLMLRAQVLGRPATYSEDGSLLTPPQISCTAPQAIDSLRLGESVWFDDGKIGGVVGQMVPEGAIIEITSAAPNGAALGPDKGINLPETEIRLPAISPEDDAALKFIAKHADLVGQSFVRSPRDVIALQSRLRELGGERVGIILKIETKQGFNNLPSLLFAAMRGPGSGVMIARGDLAVECGWERLAEIQEEILWFCEAAHAPVIWATQVLETLTKTGIPSRPEITDAATSEGAECVMLNKGPHVVDATRALDDILRRMQTHREKKSAMLRRLRVAENFSVA